MHLTGLNKTGMRVTNVATQAGQREHQCDQPTTTTPESASLALDGLVTRYADRINRLCFRLLGWRRDVDDAVQDVFLAALKALPTFRGESDVSTWLVRIAINTCRSHARQRTLRLRFFREPPTGFEPARGRGAEGDLLDRERFERVRRLIRRLPAKYREVVVLRYLEGLSVEDVGEVLGLSRNAVDVRLNRARRRMKQDLGEALEG